MKIYKNKAFDKFARKEHISDTKLCEVIQMPRMERLTPITEEVSSNNESPDRMKASPEAIAQLSSFVIKHDRFLSMASRKKIEKISMKPK